GRSTAEGRAAVGAAGHQYRGLRIGTALRRPPGATRTGDSHGAGRHLLGRRFVNQPLEVPSVTRVVDQGRVDAYAEAARDHNPIHIDEAFAASTPFGQRIAHGMLVLSLVSEAMTAAYGTRWAA